MGVENLLRGIEKFSGRVKLFFGGEGWRFFHEEFFGISSGLVEI